MADLENQKNNARELRQELDEILFLQRSFTDEALKAAKAVLGTTENARKAARAFRGISNITEEINAGIRGVIDGEKTIGSLTKNREKQVDRINKLQGEADLTIQKIYGANSLLTNEITSQVGLQEKADAIQQSLLENAGALSEEEEFLLSLYADQLATLAEQEKLQQKLSDAQNATGIVSSIGSGFEGLLKNLGAGDLADKMGFKEAQVATEKYALQAGKGANKFKATGIYVKTLGKNLLKALGPVYLITELVKGIMQADKETTELKKSMALTTGESMLFSNHMAEVAMQTGDINITTSKLLETFGSLNKQFGFITNFADDTLVTMTTLTKVVGTSAEAAGNLAAASSLTGGSFEDNYKDVLATSYELQRQSGVQFDLRDILEQTGKVTGQVRANLGSNPALIAKAITQAKMFGAELDDIVGASKALLDFESSIESELQAELLIGRNLNLERARAAALAGDQVTLAQELREQAGSFEEFSSMNVIQQEALAKSIGMQADQLADILMKQEMQGKTARELRALGKDELADRLESQTLADKFNATVDKLKGIFTDVGTAFMPVLQLLGAALSIVGAIVGLVRDVIAGIGVITGLKDDFGQSGFLAGLKGAGDALGIMDDGIVPAGYGDTIIRKGEGTIALNNNDTVVAGTNLGQGSKTQERTNMLLEKLITQNDKKPQLSPVGLYEVQ